MKRLALFVGLFIAALSHGQDLFGDNKKTYMLMPAEAISSGIVGNVQISESSRFVVYSKMAVPSLDDIVDGKAKDGVNSQWYVYDRTNKTNKKVNIPSGAREVFVLGDGNTAFFSSFQPNLPQGFLNLSNGSITQTNINIETITYFGSMAYAPYLLVQQDEQTVLVVRPNGQNITIKVPAKVHLALPTGSDNGNIYFNAYRRVSPLQFGKATYRLSDGDLSFKQCTREEWIASNPAIQARSFAASEILGDLMYVKMADLPKDAKSDLPLRAKLGLIDCRPQFSYDGSFVVYQDAGALLLRDIKEIDTALAKKMFAEAQKAKAISDSKQAALALLMFASDMDDVLPGAEGWEDKVNPYCLNRDMLKNFNYTFKGGDLNSVDSPATTEMGFTLGPGGRAVAYLDGHVKWIPNP